jgi:hypothetical protein
MQEGEGGCARVGQIATENRWKQGKIFERRGEKDNDKDTKRKPLLAAPYDG